MKRILTERELEVAIYVAKDIQMQKFPEKYMLP